MASIDFCQVANCAREFRKLGLMRAEGDHPAWTERSEGRLGIPRASPSEAQPRRPGPCERGLQEAPALPVCGPQGLPWQRLSHAGGAVRRHDIDNEFSTVRSANQNAGEAWWETRLLAREDRHPHGTKPLAGSVVAERR